MTFYNKNILCDDGQYACPICEGKKAISIGLIDNQKCIGCSGTGYLVDYLLKQIKYEHALYETELKEKQELLEWIRKTSTCKTCNGDTYKTFAGCTCKECTLKGSLPWPG